MAVSRSESSGYQDSFSIGSAEDFDICCDPCSTAGLNAEANGFCIDCQENLCKTCQDAHKRTKASRHHKLLVQAQNTKPTKGAPQQVNSPPCTELCQMHPSELTKFFCSTHEVVGCNDCITLDHRTCNIRYIPDICAGIAQSKEFSTTLLEVAKMIDEEESIIKKAKSAKAENKTSLEEAIGEIETFQKKINDRLEQLKRNMIQEAQEENSSRDTNFDQLLKTVIHDSTELKTILLTMRQNQANIGDAEAFAIMKHAQAKLKASQSQSFEMELSRNKIKCIFNPSEVLENALLSTDGFGKLSTLPGSGPSDIKASIQSLTLEKEITVRTTTDIAGCDITGCAFISSSRLLLADWNNSKLKILDIDKQSVVEEKTLDTSPYEIAILPQNQVAVSLPTKQEILILGTASQLTTVRSIPVKRHCYGMVYHPDLLYVVCLHPSSLLVFDIQGGVQSDVTLQAEIDETFLCPFHIVLSLGGQHLYISDYGRNIIASITLQGKVTGVYKNDEIQKPQGLLVVPDGSLLVCDFVSGTIHRIFPDLKKGHILTKNVAMAKSICYKHDSHRILVGSQQCDHIKVFTEK